MESIQFLIFLIFSLKQVYGIPAHADYSFQGPAVGTCSGARSEIFNNNQNARRIIVEDKSDCDFYQAVTPGGKPGDPGFRQCRSRDQEGSPSLPKLPQCGGRSEHTLDYSQCPCAVKGQGTPQHDCLPTINVEDLRQQPSFCPSDLHEDSFNSLLKPPARQTLRVCSPSTHDFHRAEEVDDGRVCRTPSHRNVGGQSKSTFTIPSGFPSSNKETKRPTETDDINKNGRDVPNDCGLYFS